MPEGDTVHRAARRMNAVLAGAEVTRFEMRITRPQRRAFAPSAAEPDLRGRTIHEVAARGKHLLHRIGDHTLRTHLKMEGMWTVAPTGRRWRRPAYSARVVIEAVDPAGASWQAVGFDVAQVDLVPTAHEELLVGHLGPDPLGESWDAAEAARRVGADPRPVHVAILDQRNVAGFGNEYASELLFLRGIPPTLPANRADAAALIDLGARLIRANVDRRERVFTGDARPGRSTWVYGRDRRPCRRCGTPIRRIDLGADPTRERIAFWCPRCQPEPDNA